MNTFYLLQKGKKTPYLFLHGFLGNPFEWQEVVNFLPGKTCLAIDLPGHGKRPFSEDFIETFPFPEEKVHLVGYSLGGRIACSLMRKYPQKIEKLTLLSSHPGLLSDFEKKKRLKLDEVWGEKLSSLPIDLFLTKWYDQPIFGNFKPDLTLRKKLNAEELKKTLLHYSLGKQDIYFHKNAKVLIGEKDLKFQSLYKDYTLIKNAAHMVHLENPKDVALKL